MELDAFMELAGPPIGAALAAYGDSVLTRAEDAAASATVGLGTRILQRVWRRRDERQREALESDVADAVQDCANPDAQAALRQAVRRTLRQDPELLAELAAALPRPEPSSVTVVVSGQGSIVNTGTNEGTMSTRTVVHGDGAR
ncbi:MULTISPECIES: hypothetical protein [Streptomycetaceae]|uniref:hypothetical protein n=1 Tax=Streptomycetaceae TaxID=2062 RepID=UPI00093946C3|nr:hypothetical protein [Streptomyces sp. CB02056]OKI06901.1 hypothetical protein AMK13_15945 [Streptomyces sp. CB02056]